MANGLFTIAWGHSFVDDSWQRFHVCLWFTWLRVSCPTFFFLCLFCFCLSVHGKFRCSILLCLYVHEMLWLKHLLQMVFMYLPSYFCEDDNCQYVTKARDAWEAAQENICFSFFLFCGANNCQETLQTPFLSFMYYLSWIRVTAQCSQVMTLLAPELKTLTVVSSYL